MQNNKQWYHSSDYLTNIARRYPQLAERDHSSIGDLEILTGKVQKLQPRDIDDAKQSLRQLKAAFDWHWAQLRLTDLSIASAQLGTLRALFAGATINCALTIAWRDAQVKKLLQPNAPTEPTGLFIWGMGKLGGFDLNFSSDIDLIAFYDRETFPISAMGGFADIANRILKLCTQILNQVIDSQFVWRVDWRLRPDASVASLAMSTGAGLEFYQFRSLPWHRLALIKARAVAGDIAIGHQFLQSLNSYLWREHLDIDIIDDIFSIKEKINQEHLGLQAKPANSDPHQLAGFNLKLGSGGIREIEFIANSLQLLWGGKKRSLQKYHIDQVYAAIAEAQLLAADSVNQLLDSYHYFRRVEDALQIIGNQQRHSIPTDQGLIKQLCAILNIESFEQFSNTINELRNNVKQHYSDFFNNFSGYRHNIADWQQQDIELETSLLQQLTDANGSIVHNWYAGFTHYGTTNSQFKALRPLYQQLLLLAQQSSLECDEFVQLTHQFLNIVPKGGQYLKLFACNPSMTKIALESFVNVPSMRILLEQSPYILDSIIDGQFDYQSDFVLSNNELEWRINRLRQFVNEQLFHYMQQLIIGNTTSEQLQQSLTRLAEETISLGLKIASDEGQIAQLPIDIIGMGKLGSQTMQPLSDLDLVFISKANSDNIAIDDIQRLIRRFRHIMSVKTKQGIAYEMDTRLRPSGNSGAVIVSLANFEHYHFNKALNWEHIALVAGRALNINKIPSESERHLQTLIERIIATPRQPRQFKNDAYKMLVRVRQQRITDLDSDNVALKIELVKGGVFETDYLHACWQLLPNQDYDWQQLKKIRTLWNKIQTWSRMLNLENQPITKVPSHLIDKMLADIKSLGNIGNFQQLQQHIDTNKQWVINQIEQFFEGIDETINGNQWQETNVEWL